MNLYERLAAEFEDAISKGLFKPGEKIPSVRLTSKRHGVSITTVLRAYLLLESRGAIESHPQSGYFVRRPSGSSIIHEQASPIALPLSTEVDVSGVVLRTLRSVQAEEMVPFGSPYPDQRLFPFHRIHQYANSIAREGAHWSVLNDLPPGNPELIRQVARRYVEQGVHVDPNEILITVGATEAINLCLQAVAKPGDTIAVESPTFYAMLHAIERMGMRAVQVPTHPGEGIDLAALSNIVQQQDIAACMVMTNFQNPLGFVMPDEKKEALVQMLAERDIPIIENDVYSEFYFGATRPKPLKSFDRKGLVLHCSSFSKSLTSAYRIGWAMPGRYRARVEKLKFLNTLGTSSIQQLALAEYLKYEGYERHLRKIRRTFAQNLKLLSVYVKRFFPAGTRITSPAGGYVLWVELPEQVDSMALYKEALEHGITLAPGRLFSAGNEYRHCIRLNYSYTWSKESESAVILLGRLIAAQLAKSA
jgi:DNA-binding transcriptional MocR family regulator